MRGSHPSKATKRSDTLEGMGRFVALFAPTGLRSPRSVERRADLVAVFRGRERHRGLRLRRRHGRHLRLGASTSALVLLARRLYRAHPRKVPPTLPDEIGEAEYVVGREKDEGAVCKPGNRAVELV